MSSTLADVRPPFVAAEISLVRLHFTMSEKKKLVPHFTSSFRKLRTPIRKLIYLIICGEVEGFNR